jgi:hypothetical protein
LIKQAGFEDQELVETTGYKSSPVTTGALFRANKKVERASLTEAKGPEIPGEPKEVSMHEQETCSTST